ncbi:hypothetical protein D8Y22_16605 [Salinadaptatus halalkaliphilus]|uniref:Uncharacterized protein n=1 Tax=Salinadaptatus halalkaliphilus TaxID=2419781 RepID=A0A4V6RUB8_9EURY|nr:hypothetical protein [Salinadaptatus halalkaliphilus]THE63457.1 hypothetical protein D8Y22_16605 [Salinadaptatus halalkaliphilus]
MRRRAVLTSLAAATAGTLAGCVGVGGGCSSGTDLAFEPVDPAEIASRETADDIAAAPAMMADLATRTLEGESPTVEVVTRSPISWLTYVERDGQFYEIHEETLESGTVTGPAYELERDRDTDDDHASADAISFDELPVHDQWRINDAAGFTIEEVEHMSFTASTVAGYLADDDQADSVLAAGVDEPYLAVDGHLIGLERHDEDSTSAHRIRHTAQRVAENVDGFAGHVLERRGAELPEPTEDVQALLEDAREDGGSINVCDHDVDDNTEAEAQREAVRRDAIEELRTTLQDLEDDPDTPDRIEYVEYEGEWHRISISNWVV